MLNARNFVFVLAVGGGLVMAAPVRAAAAADRLAERDFERRAYDNGFRTGVERGERDAQERRDSRVERSRDYRDADEGFRGGGDRDAYRRVFQDGFRSGYADGYKRVSRLDRGRAVTPVVPYPENRAASASIAARSGYRDGFEAGHGDARDGDPYNPRLAKRYREADREYSGRASRDDFKREYRAAFEDGYSQGYRDARR
jgi:hypothetical protein